MSGLEYRIVRWRFSLDRPLSEQVNELIAQGWEPLGGVSIAITQNYMYGEVWAQAMIRRKP